MTEVEEVGLMTMLMSFKEEALLKEAGKAIYFDYIEASDEDKREIYEFALSGYDTIVKLVEELEAKHGENA